MFSIREAIDNPRQAKQRNMSSGHTSTSHGQQCFKEKADDRDTCNAKKKQQIPTQRLTDFNANVTQCNY